MTYKKIPGWLSNNDGNILKTLAKIVPDNGTILEIGSYVGRSTCCISEEINESIDFYCVDIWNPSNLVDINDLNLLKQFNCDLSDIFPNEENFIKNTKKYNNIIRIKENIINIKINKKFDLIFLDALYTESYIKKIIKSYF